MKHFACSDTHFGHKNIIRYCNRPFSSVDEMNEHMIMKWNSVVSDEDTVWFLGDFAFLKLEETFAIFDRLRGQIKIVPGNHDERLLEEWNQSEHWTRKRIEILDPLVHTKIDGRPFVLCHYPIEDWAGMYWPTTKGTGEPQAPTLKHTAMLHGHCHGNRPNTTWRFDVGIDVYGKPVRITNDLEFLKKPVGWTVIK